MVISPAVAADPDARAERVDELAGHIRRWTGNPAHIVDLTPDVLAAMVAAEDPLVDSWRADHVHLAGTRLLDLLGGPS